MVVLPPFPSKIVAKTKWTCLKTVKCSVDVRGSDSKWPRDKVLGAKKNHGQREGTPQLRISPAIPETHWGGARLRWPQYYLCTCHRHTPWILPPTIVFNREIVMFQIFTGHIGVSWASVAHFSAPLYPFLSILAGAIGWISLWETCWQIWSNHIHPCLLKCCFPPCTYMATFSPPSAHMSTLQWGLPQLPVPNFCLIFILSIHCYLTNCVFYLHFCY